MNSNELLEHVRLLNIKEKEENDKRKQAALQRIKELRERIRREQETSTSKNTVRDIC